MSAAQNGTARELERAQERAGGEVADAATACALEHGQPAASDTARVVASLARLADLHAELSDAYAALAVETGEIRLAAPADPSVHAPVTTGFHPAAPEPREFLSQAALADMLDVHPRTLRRLELSGDIPAATSIGSIKRWRRSTIQEWLDAGQPRPRKARR